MVYLDTSCLLKLLREEPESQAVRDATVRQKSVVVSSLAELEAEIQLKSAALGGEIRASQWRHYQAKLAALRNFEPFEFQYLPAAVFSTALRQHRHPRAAYCRTLDRLHLAAMEELKLTQILTLDEMQAKAARHLDYKVISPGRDKASTHPDITI